MRRVDREEEFTDNSKPIVRARFFTSSISSSTEGSLVLLFSQCHKRGPVRNRIMSSESGLREQLWVHDTEVDPDPPRRKYPMNNPEIVHDILGLEYGGPRNSEMRKGYVMMRLTVSIKKQVMIAFHCPD